MNMILLFQDWDRKGYHEPGTASKYLHEIGTGEMIFWIIIAIFIIYVIYQINKKD